MYYKCCVPGCVSSRQDAILHKFPKCQKRLNKWLMFIKCDTLRNKSVNELNHLQVCHKHFEARFVTKKSRLLSIAYPTLFLESEFLSGVPINRFGFTGTMHPIVDHQYAKKMLNEHNYCLSSEVQPVEDSPSEIYKEHADVLPSTSAAGTSKMSHLYHQERMVLDVLPSTSTAEASKMDHMSQQELLVSDSILKQTKVKNKIKAVSKLETLTPRCRQLYNQYRKSRKLLSFTRRAKKALKFCKASSFEEMAAGLKPIAKKLLWMQIKLCTKKEKARRFTLDEKLISLSILKQGPKSYRFLQKIFILPSVTTLKKMISTLKIISGINSQIFESIKEEVNTWKKEKKYCTIIFDEMSLETGVTYTYNDEICGFVELQNKTSQFADHALVFMIKGVIHKWQQPIAFYFCEGATAAIKLKRILIEVITAVGETGLIPLALVSDQGAAFQSALKNLQEETRRSQILENQTTDDTIHIGGFNLCVIYDPCHLIKGLRNNFLSKNISFQQKIATWSDIVDVYKTDCQHTETRLLHKLNDEHVIPEKIKKMKVKNCVRVFSKTVAGALNFTSAFSHYSDGRPISTTLKNTAEVVSFFDDLFDSVNGTAVFNAKRKGKELRSAVTGNSKHHAFWQEAIVKLKQLKFVDRNGRDITVPSIKNWISTLQSMQRLWQMLSNNNIKIMRPRYLNSDAIENFFGQVRSYNFRDNNPTCHNFVSTFKSLLITGFIKFHHESFNCENDDSNQLLKMKSLFNELRESKTKNVCGESDYESCVETYPALLEARRERLTIQSRAYTAGWVVRKILLKVNCSHCKKDLTVEKSSEVHAWIAHREYKKSTQKKLTYPAESIVRYFGMIFDATNQYLESKAHINILSENIKKEIISKNKFEHISCPRHRDQVIHALLAIVIKLCIHNWCTVINKILKGTDIMRLERRSSLPEMQAKALEKYKKKLKKKNK